jgi:hypothetical protein
MMITILIAALAAQPAASSVYTPLVLDRCTIVEERPEEEGFTRWRCPGHGAIPLFVSSGEGRFDIDAGLDTGQFEFFNNLNRPAPRVEWRLRGGVPVAIIYRLLIEPFDSAPGSALIVKTIGRAGRPGCLIAAVNGTLPDANALARAAADRAPRFRCGVDQADDSVNGH